MDPACSIFAETEGKSLIVESDVLLDRCIHALSVLDVKIRQVILKLDRVRKILDDSNTG